MTGGTEPRHEWLDEVAEWTRAFQDAIVDPMEHRRPIPEVARRIEEHLPAATVHLGIDWSSDGGPSLDLFRRDPEAEARAVIGPMVARYAAEHPGIVRPT